MNKVHNAYNRLLMAAYYQWILDGRPKRDQKGAEILRALIMKGVGIHVEK
jgi:hypothetical protein